MVDVGGKDVTRRVARAGGRIAMQRRDARDGARRIGGEG